MKNIDLCLPIEKLLDKNFVSEKVLYITDYSSRGSYGIDIKTMIQMHLGKNIGVNAIGEAYIVFGVEDEKQSKIKNPYNLPEEDIDNIYNAVREVIGNNYFFKTPVYFTLQTVNHYGFKLPLLWVIEVDKLAKIYEKFKPLIKVIGDTEQSSTELLESSPFENKSTFRNEFLTPAKSYGLIETTLPEFPRTPNQKYRLTEKGKAILKYI